MHQSLRDRVRALWGEVFDGDDYADDDHFFQVGGNSFLALTLLDRVRKDQGVTIALAQFFRNPTIGGLVEEIVAQHEPAAEVRNG